MLGGDNCTTCPSTVPTSKKVPDIWNGLMDELTIRCAIETPCCWKADLFRRSWRPHWTLLLQQLPRTGIASPRHIADSSFTGPSPAWPLRRHPCEATALSLMPCLLLLSFAMHPSDGAAECPGFLSYISSVAEVVFSISPNQG